MDNAVCNAIYLDRSAKRTGVVKKDDVQLRPSSGDLSQTHGDATCEETAQTNIQAILTVLDQGRTGCAPPYLIAAQLTTHSVRLLRWRSLHCENLAMG